MKASVFSIGWVAVLASIAMCSDLPHSLNNYILSESVNNNTAIDWLQQSQHAAWSPRDSMGEVVFQNKMWLLGGYLPLRTNEVWYSSNGMTWTQAANAPWGGRNLLCSVVYNNKVWIMGGFSNDNPGMKTSTYNDVWYSSDGTNWTQATANAPWSRRAAATALVYNNKMWIMGGFRQDDFTHYNDVWYSTDGASWTQATANAPWIARGMHSSVVYDGKMWIMGGGVYNTSSPQNTVVDYNDVWYSTDGVNWTQATSAAAWVARRFHCSVIYDGKMWVIQGFSRGNRNDVWYSTDGVNWAEAVPNGAVWTNRHESSCLVFNGSLWLMGGNSTPPLQNDIWAYTAPKRVLKCKKETNN